MSTPIIIKYPLDLTGQHPNNLVLGEPHDIGVRPIRALVPNHGPFYTQYNLLVRDIQNGTTLTPNEQFVAMHLYAEAVERTGLEVCAAIVITDPSVSNQISIDYQVVGGEYSSSMYAIRQALATLELDDRSVIWGQNIVGLPDAFPPTHHLHDAGDLYGFEYVVAALEDIYRAILLGDQTARGEIRQYVDLQDEQLVQEIARVEGDFKVHLADKTNPHNVTKAQVGLGGVQNYGIATKAQAEAGTLNNVYMTPLRVKEAIEVLAGNLLQQHVDRQDNPHGVTADQLGLGNVPNYPVASQLEAETGTSNQRLMTPLRDRQAFVKWLADATRNGYVFPRNSHNFALRFSAGPGSSDPGGIEHITDANDNSTFRLIVSDNPSGQVDDVFELGGGNTATSGGATVNFVPWLKITHNDAHFNGTINVQDFYMRSDRRAKSRIKRITRPLDRLKQLGGYTYHQRLLGTASAGLLAQEVQAALPESVRLSDPTDPDSHLNVQLAGPVALLVEVVKEQAKRIERLQTEVRALKRKVK